MKSEPFRWNETATLELQSGETYRCVELKGQDDVLAVEALCLVDERGRIQIVETKTTEVSHAAKDS